MQIKICGKPAVMQYSHAKGMNKSPVCMLHFRQLKKLKQRGFTVHFFKIGTRIKRYCTQKVPVTEEA